MLPALDPAERRHLTLFFSDLSDSTGISAAMEPECYDDLLQHLRGLFGQIIPRHGGRIVRIDGDGVLCVFGYPDAYEDAGRRATEAAIDLHQAAYALDRAFGTGECVIRLHSGIHSGVVLVRSGDVVRGWIEVLGDATNLAARLCDQAAADQILVSDAALGADRLFYTTIPRQLPETAGRQRPLRAFQVLGRASAKTRFGARARRGLTPLEGRSAELERLLRLLDADATRPGLAAVVGPPGIGKTRLLGEFVDRAALRGTVIHSGYCEAYLGARPLQPFAQIVQSILHDNPDPGGTVDPVIQALLLASGERQPPGPAQVVEALAALLDRSANGRTCVLSIDDWQWADDASRQCLRMLAARARARILFLLSSRSEPDFLGIDLQPDLILLEPLSRVEAAAAAEGLLTTAAPFLVDRVCTLAGGNPLFLEELCHGLEAGDELNDPRDVGGWMAMLVQARLARLTPGQADLVRKASVIGHVFSHSLFETLTGVGVASPLVAALVADDFLYEGEVSGTLRFKHALTREAVYAGVGRKERIELHRRIAEVLHRQRLATGSDVHVEALAYHFHESADYERAFDYALLAGEAAMAVSALDRGQRLYEMAYRALSALPRQHLLWEGANALVGHYGRACAIDPARGQLPVLESMAIRARERGATAGAAISEYWLGTVLYGLGDARASIRRLEHARGFVEEIGHKSLAAHVIAGLGQSHGAACHYPEAIRLIELAIALKKPHWRGTSASPGLAYLAATRGLLHADEGSFAEAERWFHQGIGYLAGEEHQIMASILGHQIAARLWQGDYDGAIAVAARCTQVAERVKARYLFAISRALSAYASWRLSGDLEAIAAMLKHTEWLNQGASRQRISLLYGWLAEIMVSLERHDEARSYARLALWRARHGDRLGEASCCRALARLAARTNSSRRGVAHYLTRASHSATLRSSRHEQARNALCAAELALESGAREEAMGWIERAEPALVSMAMRHDLEIATAIKTAALR